MVCGEENQLSLQTMKKWLISKGEQDQRGGISFINKPISKCPRRDERLS